MKLADYDERLREAWAVHQVFLKLGFTAEQIWVGVWEETGLTVHLRAQGREFVYVVGLVTGDEVVTLRTTWTRLVRAFLARTFPLPDVHACYESSHVRKQLVPFVQAMLDMGFVLPRELN